MPTLEMGSEQRNPSPPGKGRSAQALSRKPIGQAHLDGSKVTTFQTFAILTFLTCSEGKAVRTTALAGGEQRAPWGAGL